MSAFTQDPAEHWRVANTNVFESTNLLACITDETYCLPLVLEPGNKTHLSALTQGYGGNLTCQLLQVAGNTVRQISKMDKNSEVGINVAIAISDEGLVRCAVGVTIP